MKNKIKGFVAGLIFSALVGTVAFASPAMREIFFNVNVNFNGARVNFSEDSQPFTMNDRVFLPVRAVAELVGLDVDFFDGVVNLYTNEKISDENIFANKNIFSLEDFGFVFKFPETWNKTDELGFDSPLGTSISFSKETLPREMTSLEYIASAAESAASEGLDVDYVLVSHETKRIGNFRWFPYKTTMTMQILGKEMNVSGHYFVNVQGNIARVISIIASDASESIDEILEMFGEI
ncbi:MAG: copper amine oxidase N-terminal domain-containing protein [Defluviitaleaceae bacterium]|nr:copper amine oxidase N-terminal domain-containing protein [Defluviitaleaceae bacterium]